MRKIDFIVLKSIISPKKVKTIFFLGKSAGKIEKRTPVSKMARTDPYGEINNFSRRKMPH